MSLAKEIEALKIILNCFFDEPENVVERNKLIKRRVAENEHVKTYARFSEEELKRQLEILQSQLYGTVNINFIVFMILLMSILIYYFLCR